MSELVELSRRCMLPASTNGDEDETDRSLLNADNCNTLKRSASKRIKVSFVNGCVFNSKRKVKYMPPAFIKRN